MGAPSGALSFFINYTRVMETGKIVQLLERDSGFIQRTGVKEHLFFHADGLSNLRFGDLHIGDRVRFMVTESRKGPYATNVSRNAAK